MIYRPGILYEIPRNPSEQLLPLLCSRIPLPNPIFPVLYIPQRRLKFEKLNDSIK